MTESPTGYFSLEGDLNRNTVPKFWPDASPTLQQCAASGGPVLDMQAIVKTDTAGLAWLINLLKECRQQKIQLQLKNIPETLINLAKISDVDSFLSVQ